MSRKEHFNQKLLVEGNNEFHIISALCERFSINENFDIIDNVGKDNLKKKIPVRLKSSELKTLGIIVDADTNLEETWQSIRDILSKQGYTIPDIIPENGLTIKNLDMIKIGVWIMPNNHLTGILEDFMQHIISNDDKLYPEVKTFLSELEAANLNKYTHKDKSKAIIHSWLAVQETPGSPMGLGITKNYFDTDKELAIKFTNWLKELFSED